MNDTSKDDPIRNRAYELWEENGKPEGSAMDFWLQAEREIAAKQNQEAGEEESGASSL